MSGSSVGVGAAARSCKIWVCVVGLSAVWTLSGCSGRETTHAAARPETRRPSKRGAAGKPAPPSEDAAISGDAAAESDAAVDGHDAAPPAADAAVAGRDASAAGAAGEPAGGTTGGAGSGGAGSSGRGGSGGSDGTTCTPFEISTDRVTPTVWLVIDGSGSMADGIAGPMTTPTRWDVLRQTLLDPSTGVVPQLDERMKFGMVIYDGPLGGSPGTTNTLPDGGPATNPPPTQEGACPRLVTVEPALNNFAQLDRAFTPLPQGGSTPTHKALAHVLSLQPPHTPDTPIDLTYLVLATDGAPNDFCGMIDPFGSNPGGGPMIQAEVVSLTQRLAMQGTPVYVISLAADDPTLATHLTAVAEAGGTKTPPFTPQTKDRLIETFRQILGPEVLCTIKLPSGTGLTLPTACMGTVKLNDMRLECDSDNGWKLRDPTTLEITGAACDVFKSPGGAHLVASFPCGMALDR